MFPYLDLAGVQLRSLLRPSYFTDIESLTPGFTVQALATQSSVINSQMRKRYGGQLPWGQGVPPLVAAGVLPPAVSLAGRPTLGSLQIVLQLLIGGALGTATFQWSANAGSSWAIASALVATGTSPPAVTVSGLSSLAKPSLLVIQVTSPGILGVSVVQYSLDGGVTWTTGITTASAVALGASGLTANFPAGTYSGNNAYTGQGLATAASVTLGSTGLAALFPAGTYDPSNIYAAAPPVPETILRWLTDLVTEDVAIRHGFNSNDPAWEKIEGRAALARKQIEEAANTKDGLWDLPVSEDLQSAVDTGGPVAYSEQSPYTWQYKQAAAAERETRDVVRAPNKLVGG